MGAQQKPARRAAARRNNLLVALLLAVLGGLFGIGLGHFFGGAAGRGFRIDWYQYRPPGAFDAYEVGMYAAVAAALTGAAMIYFGIAVGFRMGAGGLRDARAGRPARSRGAHMWRGLFWFALVAPLALGVIATLFLASTGLTTNIAGDDVATLSLLAAGLAGGVAAFVGYHSTVRGLRAGTIFVPPPTENIFAKIALACARNARVSILVLLVLSGVFAVGLGRLDTNVDVADVLPRGDPNTLAAKNLTEKFKSSFTLQVTFQLHVTDQSSYNSEAARKIPNRATSARFNNISDELYVRAIDELLVFAKGYRCQGQDRSLFTASVALPDLYRIINWTAAGGRNASQGDAAFALPDTSRAGSVQFAAVDAGVWRAIAAAADALISPDGLQTAALITVSSTETTSGKEIGACALEIRSAYVAWLAATPSAYQVFSGDNTPKFSVDLPIANAHSSELASKDFKRLLPIIGAWILVTVFLAFRNASSIVIAFSALAMGVVWTFGLMGYMGIPLNTLNLTVIPLIMGVGIDYGIHTLNEYQESRASGRTPEDSFRKLGGHAFFALFVATLNTVVGLAVMIASPSLLIAQLGILTVIAISSSYLITITFIPAALSLNPNAKAHEYRPSPLMGGLARLVSRWRLIALLVIVLITAVLLPATSLVPIEAFGDPPRNWLEDDPLRQEHVKAINGFYNSTADDIKANILIFEGDINDPAAHRYMDAIDSELRRYQDGQRNLPPNAIAAGQECSGQGDRGPQGRVIADTLRTLPFFVRTYMTVKDGVPGAAGFLALERIGSDPRSQQDRPYPATRGEISALLDDAQVSPLRGLGTLFYDHPDDQMAMMLFSVRAASYEDAREVWCQVQSVLATPSIQAMRPPTMHVSFFGNTAINYLFVAKELPWVGYMSIVSNTLVLAFVYLPTRLVRLTLLVGVLNFLAGVWWFALLPTFGVGQAITLTLPLVYIYAIGSDFGLHLALNAISLGNTEEAFRTTGKGVLFSGITTFGAFLIYTQMSNVAVQRTMIATAAAIPIIFLVTMLTVPLLYPVGKRFKKEHSTLEKAEHVELPEEPLDEPAQPILEEAAPLAPVEAEPPAPAKRKVKAVFASPPPKPRRRRRD